MAYERTSQEVLSELMAMARALWGEEDAERQRSGLSVSSEQIATQSQQAIPVDLEPRFF